MRLFLGLYSMAARSTLSGSNDSFRFTWSNGRVSTQVDHFLTHLHSTVYLRRLQCTKATEIAIDHKLLLCNITEKAVTCKAPLQVLSRTRQRPTRLNAAPL